MSDIVVARTDEERRAMYAFLCAQGVRLQPSVAFQSMGVVRGEQLVAVVAFDGFCGRACSMHAAGVGGHWASRELLWAVFDYPFRQLDLVAVFAPVASDNARALKLDRHLGFEEVHRVRDGWAHGVDLVLLEMTRAQCRWHRGRQHMKVAA